MGRQVSASRTDLLLHCTRPFDPDLEVAPTVPTEPMLYGSCIHGLADYRLKGGTSQAREAEECVKWGVEDVVSAQVHVGVMLECLRKWCEGDNPLGVKFRVMLSEVPQATSLTPFRTRVCGFDAETHTYDLKEGEIAGTFDVLLCSIEEDPKARPRYAVVVDHKTGLYGDWTDPGALPQMRTLVMQTRARKQWGAEKWYAAILSSPRDMPPVMYLSDEITLEDSAAHLGKLRVAHSRIGDGSLTPGEWCFRCPAKEGCPSNDGALLARSGAMVKMSTKELMKEAVEPGQLHMFLAQFDALAKRARAALRAEVARGEIIYRPDGKTLVLREKTTERLSKSSIVKKLGKEKGEAVIEALRKQGLTETETHLELVAVDGDK